MADCGIVPVIVIIREYELGTEQYRNDTRSADRTTVSLRYENGTPKV